MTSLLANYSNGAINPFTHVIEAGERSGSGVVAIGVGGVIGVLLFIVMIAVYFAIGRNANGKPTLPMATYEGFAFSSPPPLLQQPAPLSIPPYPVGARVAITTATPTSTTYEAPDPVGVFRTFADPDAAVIETGPMSAVVISSKPSADLDDENDDDDFKTTVDADAFLSDDDGRTIVGLGTYSEELAEELALHQSWLREARRAELLATDSSPLVTVLGEEDFDFDEVTPQIISGDLKKRPKIRRISPSGPRYENHP